VSLAAEKEKVSSSWKSVRFPKVVRFQEGPGVRNWQFRNEGIKLVNVRNIVDGELVLSNTERHLDPEEVKTKYRHFLFDEGDLVLSSSGVTWGKIAEVRKEHLPLCLNTSMIRLSPLDREGIDKAFLRIFIESRFFRSQILRLITGSAQPNFGPSHLEQIEIPLPPLAEQRRIAEVLDRAEALRAKRRAALAQLDSLTQSLFLDLFGDPTTNPKGWPKSSLAEVCSIAGQYGSGVPATEFSPSLPRYVRITDIDSEGNLAPNRVSPGGTSADWSDLKLETGDVLFARSGATVGKTYMFSPADADCVFAGYLIRFRPLSEKLLPEVLFHFTRSEAYLGWVVARQRVVAQPNINAKQYGTELSVPLPPIPLQREFARRVTAVEALKTAQRASLAELDALFATLQHRAFRGEL